MTVCALQPETSSLSASLAELADYWSALGLWITWWDDQDRCTPLQRTEPPFWRALWQHSEQFQEEIKPLHRRAELDGARFHEPPGLPGVCVFVIPVYHADQWHGSVIVCAATSHLDDAESFSRLCSRLRQDEKLLRSLAEDVTRVNVGFIEQTGRLLTHLVEQAVSMADVSEQTDSLALHLSNTYEELNLVYRLGGVPSVAETPEEFFTRMFAELIERAQFKCLGLVLADTEKLDTQEDVFLSCPCVADKDCLKRIIHSVDVTALPDDILVVNELTQHDALDWAGDWARRLLIVSVRHKGAYLGSLIAIDKKDDSPFSSVDARFLASMANRGADFLGNYFLYRDQQSLMMGMLDALVSSIDAKDPYTRGHSQRVAYTAKRIASKTDCSPEFCERVYLSGLLHDFGKIGVPEAVLCKTGRLDDQEKEQMRKHPEIGARILQDIRQLEDVLPGVLYHHERPDGRGYPLELSSRDIPWLGKVIGLADSFDAMTSTRTYRAALSYRVAAAEIRRFSGTQFDPELADVLLSMDLPELLSELNEAGRPEMSMRRLKETALMGVAQ